MRYSAEDADSEGHEGKFYCWTKAELKKLLSAEEFKVAERYFGITEEGNFEDHSHPQPLKKLNVLSIVDAKLTEAEAKLLASAKGKLFAVQQKRVRPHLDDKVLASWNGLMLGALARASVVLNELDIEPAIAVDTHVFRVSHRLKLSSGKTPDAVEQDLGGLPVRAGVAGGDCAVLACCQTCQPPLPEELLKLQPAAPLSKPSL